MNILLLNINIFLFLIFCIPSLIKMKDIAGFEKLFKMLSFPHASILSKAFIGVELIASLLVLSEKTQKIGLIIMILVCLFFVMIVLRSKQLSLSLNYNCFGSLSNESLDYKIIIRSLVILMVVIFMLFNPVDTLSFEIIPIVYALLSGFSIIVLYFIAINITIYNAMLKQIKNR